MSTSRLSGGRDSVPTVRLALREITVGRESAVRRCGGAHRLPPPPAALRGRIVVAAVAVGAVAAAVTTTHSGDNTALRLRTLTVGNDAAADFGVGVGGDAPAPEMIPVVRPGDALAEAEKLRKGAAAAARQALGLADAARQKFVKPAQGVFTSGFESRWGTFHYGVDIANRIGTPIVAAADGVVVEAGPASGFGLWVRVRLPDGTINVYGHVDTILVRQGQVVKAGEQIATMGNRGFSTGPHLHFEVWNPEGKKINPLPWLQERGITL